MNPIAVTVICGFLGAGKTTLMRQLLAQLDTTRIAVVENEFSPVDIDSSLLSDNGDGPALLRFENGCLCCKLREDWVRGLCQLAEQNDAAALGLERVLIETTGLAEPAPIVQSFLNSPELQARFRLDGIVTVIDALHGEALLTREATARHQAVYADRLLLSKTDLCTADALTHLGDRLCQLNPQALQLSVRHGQIPAGDILDLAAYALDERLYIAPRFQHRLFTPALFAPGHGDDIQAWVYEHDAPLDPVKLDELLSFVLSQSEAELLRYKGILHLKGSPQRWVLQGVQRTVSTNPLGPWPQGERPANRMVFIGRRLPIALLEIGLAECRGETAASSTA